MSVTSIFPLVALNQYTPKIDQEILDKLTSKFVILSKHLILLHVVGQGEISLTYEISLFVYCNFNSIGQFGLVYKADLFCHGSNNPTTVAVKTLKGSEIVT